jgi:hypothetical protein
LRRRGIVFDAGRKTSRQPRRRLTAYQMTGQMMIMNACVAPNMRLRRRGDTKQTQCDCRHRSDYGHKTATTEIQKNHYATPWQSPHRARLVTAKSGFASTV